MTEVGFGFGSNIGDKLGHIRAAMASLFESRDIVFLAAASFYRTPPWGHLDQDWFVNTVAIGDTRLAARELLDRCKDVERRLGRDETFRWGPRRIDIDILYLGEELVAEPDLNVPHLELFNRDFVLQPLAEVRPQLVLFGRSLAEAVGHAMRGELEVIAPPWRP